MWLAALSAGIGGVISVINYVVSMSGPRVSVDYSFFLMSYEGVTSRHGLRCPGFSDNSKTKSARKEAPDRSPEPHPFTVHYDT